MTGPYRTPSSSKRSPSSSACSHCDIDGKCERSGCAKCCFCNRWLQDEIRYNHQLLDKVHELEDQLSALRERRDFERAAILLAVVGIVCPVVVLLSYFLFRCS